MTTTSTENTSVKFYGGTLTILLPILFFLAATVYLFIGAQAFDLTALALIGFVMLFLGSLLAREQAKYWKAAMSGIASEVSATVVVLLLSAGVFSAMMKAGASSLMVCLPMRRTSCSSIASATR